MKTRDDLTDSRTAALAQLPYDAAAAIADVEAMVAVISGSGLDGAHAACVRLDRARRIIRRTVGRLSAQDGR